jgi:glycosyltransferase involved in cell wall biosynthesis
VGILVVVRPEHMTNRKAKICYVNTYLEGREADVSKGLYPRNHLWGADALQDQGFEVTIAPGRGTDFISQVARKLSKLTKFRLGDLEQEWQIIKLLRQGFDAIYVANGDLFFLILLKKLNLLSIKIVTWVYTPPKIFPVWQFRNVKNSPWLLQGYDGFLCLTKKAAQYYSAIAPKAFVKNLDWAADTVLFSPRQETQPNAFFFCCGRTNRDYATLMQAAKKIDFSIYALVSPSYLSGLEIPSNVRLIQGPENASNDRGLSYPEMIDAYYANCQAMLIPRLPDPDDTCGFTNLLEAMAMGKPVIMTKTGALDIDIEAEGFGIYVEPNDAEGWVRAMKLLIDEPERALAMGARARKAALRYYNLERFGQDLNQYFLKLLNT